VEFGGATALATLNTDELAVLRVELLLGVECPFVKPPTTQRLALGAVFLLALSKLIQIGGCFAHEVVSLVNSGQNASLGVTLTSPVWV